MDKHFLCIMVPSNSVVIRMGEILLNSDSPCHDIEILMITFVVLHRSQHSLSKTIYTLNSQSDSNLPQTHSCPRGAEVIKWGRRNL